MTDNALSSGTRGKVLLIGWDAADWKVIMPLLDAGKMPNLERFVNEGVMGDLSTLSPSLSPMLWTSIATGKRPYKHGIHGFVEPDPHGEGVRPVSCLSRKTRAVWNILHHEGMTCNVVGWWPSHPVEPIRGVMVSNHYHTCVAPRDKPWPVRPGTIHPPRLVQPLADLRVHPQELDAGQIGPFVPDFAEIDTEKDRRLAMLTKTLAECATVHAAATALIQLEPWDFMAVYYDAIDHFCHGFMRYHPPRMRGVSEEDFERYKGVVEGAYRFHDAMLGVLLEFAGPDTTVVLVSDHGFHPDSLRPRRIPHAPAGPTVQHSDHGILLMKGPGIKQDERLYGAGVLDVVPTILTVFGLPVGRDMDGRPLVIAFEAPPDITAVDSWDGMPGEDGSHPPGARPDPVIAAEALKQLVSLGYIEEPDADKAKAAEEAIAELRFNEAMSYVDAHMYAKAAGLLEDIVARWPNESRFGLQLVGCYQALQRSADARRVLDGVIARKTRKAGEAAAKLAEWQEQHSGQKIADLPDKERHEWRRVARDASTDPFTNECVQGVQLLNEGEPETAITHFLNAEIVDPAKVVVHLRKGQAFLAMKRWCEAEESFRDALARDGQNPQACVGLCASLLKQRRARETTTAALDAIALGFHNPAAHYFLGVALHRRGMIGRAMEAFRVCVAQNPNFVPAHERLARIYENRVGNKQAAAEHRRLASEARTRAETARDGEPLFDAEEVQPQPMTSAEDLMAPGTDIVPEMTLPLSETVTVVSGLPRSGTSMMMQMLAAGGLPPLADESRPPDRHNERGYFEYSPVKALRRDGKWLPEAKGKAIKVIVQLLPYVHRRADQHYRIIFMERIPAHVLASQKKMLGVDQPLTGSLSDESLLKAYRQQVQHVRRLLAMVRFPVVYVSYEQCLREPEAVAARVNALLGGPLDERAMAAAVDPALCHHRKD